MVLSWIDILFLITVVLLVFNGFRNGAVFSLITFLGFPLVYGSFILMVHSLRVYWHRMVFRPHHSFHILYFFSEQSFLYISLAIWCVEL